MKLINTMQDYLIQITHTRKGKSNNEVMVTTEECRSHSEAEAVERVLTAVRWYYQNNPSHSFTAKCLGLAETELPRIDSTTLGSKGVRPYNAKAESMRKQNKSKKLLKEQNDAMDRD